MNAIELDAYFKKYYQEGEKYTAQYLFGLYFKAVQEYCAHFFAVSKYAEEVGSGVIPESTDELDALVIAGKHLAIQKEAFMTKLGAQPEGCTVKELSDNLSEFDASAFCLKGKARVVNGLLEGSQLSLEKMQEQLKKVRPSELAKCEQATYLMTICSQRAQKGVG